MRRLIRLIVSPWRWMLLLAARDERRRRNADRLVRRLNESPRVPAFVLRDGVLVPLGDKPWL